MQDWCELAWSSQHDSLGHGLVKRNNCFCADDTRILVITVQRKVVLDFRVPHVSGYASKTENWEIIADSVALDMGENFADHFQVQVLIVRALITNVVERDWILYETIGG